MEFQERRRYLKMAPHTYASHRFASDSATTTMDAEKHTMWRTI